MSEIENAFSPTRVGLAETELRAEQKVTDMSKSRDRSVVLNVDTAVGSCRYPRRRPWFRGGVPFVGRGDPGAWSDLEVITPSWLRRRFGAQTVELVASGQEQYGGAWQSMSLAAFVDYLEECEPLGGPLGAPGAGAPLYMSEDLNFIDHLGLEEAVCMFVRQWIPRSTFLWPEFAFWMGPASSRTGLHADPDGFNLLCQIYGKKRLYVVPPRFHRYVPKSDRFDAGARVSVADIWNRASAERFPSLSRIDALSVVLEPGDILYMPRWWWHAAENLGPSIALSYRAESMQSALQNLPTLGLTLLHEWGLYRAGNCTCHPPDEEPER